MSLRQWHASLHGVPYSVSPPAPPICSVDWSSRWGRHHPGSGSCRRAWPEMWSGWTGPEPRPPAGTSGCSGCTRSFPQTFSAGTKIGTGTKQVSLSEPYVHFVPLLNVVPQVQNVLKQAQQNKTKQNTVTSLNIHMTAKLNITTVLSKSLICKALKYTF